MMNPFAPAWPAYLPARPRQTLRGFLLRGASQVTLMVAAHPRNAKARA